MNPNKFLTLLMNKVPGALADMTPTEPCPICGHSIMQHPDHLSNPLPVLKWMEEHMPEVWEDYLEWVFHTLNYDSERAYTADIKSILDLNNLVQFLVENPEWGEKECAECIGKGGTSVLGFIVVCPTCNGTGKIIHPALRYAHSKEEG